VVVVAITPVMVEMVVLAAEQLVAMMVFQRQAALQQAVKVMLAVIQMAQLEVHMELLEVVEQVPRVRMDKHLVVVMVDLV
jgi:hypothetical protein